MRSPLLLLTSALLMTSSHSEGQAEAQWLEDFTAKARGGANCQGVDLWKTDAPAYGYNGSYAGYMYTEEAIRVIKERDAAKPLFMFTAFQNIHPPLQVPQAYMQKYVRHSAHYR